MGPRDGRRTARIVMDQGFAVTSNVEGVMEMVQELCNVHNVNRQSVDLSISTSVSNVLQHGTWRIPSVVLVAIQETTIGNTRGDVIYVPDTEKKNIVAGTATGRGKSPAVTVTVLVS